jgi:hypothetical protein
MTMKKIVNSQILKGISITVGLVSLLLGIGPALSVPRPVAQLQMQNNTDGPILLPHPKPPHCPPNNPHCR